MKQPAALFLLTIFVSSCVSHDFADTNTCGVVDPINKLDWLQDRIQEINNSPSGRSFWYITEATYLNQTVFLERNCCPNCLTVPPPVYNCQGVLLFNLDAEREGQINSESIIWKHADNGCRI